MADDPDRDLIPTKEDPKISHVSPSVVYTEHSDGFSLEKPTVLDRKVAEQLSRNDIEDQLYKLKDENLELKKTSRKQEEQLKRMTTKMSRLMSERKRDVQISPNRKRDVEMEEAMEELHDKVRNLEKSNVQLREKLLVAKQKIIRQTNRPNAYQYVPPKVNTGRPRSAISANILSSNLRGPNSAPNQRGNISALPPYVIQLLDEARNDIFNLKELVCTQKNEIDMYEQEVELLKDRLQMKDVEFEEEINVLKSQITEGQRHHVQENLDLIRLHRELKHKNSKIVSLQSQLAEMEEKLRNQRTLYEHLAREVEDKAAEVREEQKKNVELVTELQKNKIALQSLSELQDEIKSLKKENEVLKDTNDKFIKSVLNPEREKSSQSTEHLLKDRISQLEAQASNEMREKNVLLEDVRAEKEKYKRLSEEHLSLQNSFADIKKHTEELESKMNILKEEDVDFEELGEALALIKLKKQQSVNINFLESVSNHEEEQDLKSKLLKAEREHSDTIKELCHVREMLLTQYKINQSTQEELKSLSEIGSQKEKEYQTKLEEYATLLDMRAAKIQKLENQLNDIAYGTKKFKMAEYQESHTDSVETLELGRGENLFEIHIVKFIYSEEGLKFLKNSNPTSFFTWNFYEFELQSTPVVKGASPHFDCSAQYRVKVDDFFLFHLHKNTTTLELHESLGTDYRTLATCQLSFSELLEQPHGRLHCTQHLISLQELSSGIVFGTVQLWVKLHIPMEEAFKLYKQKFKALKYIQNNHTATAAAAKLLDQPLKKDADINYLHIKMNRCANLRNRDGSAQPSAFCVYEFYNLPEHDTAIVPSSNNPEFSDHHTVPIFIDADFEKYIRTQNLEIFVFDEQDPDLSSYIGKASIPLISLSKEDGIKGVFELTKDNLIESFGSIEVSLYWQHGYESPPPASLPVHLETDIEFPSHIAPLTPVLLEEELSTLLDSRASSGPPPKPPRVSKQNNSATSKPLRTSTPIECVSDSSLASNSIEEFARQKLVGDVTELQNSQNHNKAQCDEVKGQSPTSAKSGSSQVSQKSAHKNGSGSIRNNNLSDSSSKSHHSTQNLKEATFVVNAKDDLLFEEMTDEDKQALPDSDTSSELDHQIRVVSSSPAKPVKYDTPSIVIGIHELSLEPGSSVLNDSSIRMLYVEFKFLDYPIEELETPSSLPKPLPPDSIKFDYKKAFEFHPEKNREKYHLLAQMFNPDMPEASWIKFTVVSEPPSEEEGMECEDVGYAYVDLREIIRRGKDMVKEALTIYDAKATETTIGKLTVTVEAVEVLQLL